MNTIVITLNPYKNINKVSLVGGTISPYSSLNNIYKEPFFRWAKDLFQLISDELNDEFELTIKGESFEKRFFSALAVNSQDCQRITFKDYAINKNVDERFADLMEIEGRYQSNYNKNIDKINVYNDLDIALEDKFIHNTSMEDAFLVLMKEKPKLRIQDDNERIILVPSDDERMIYLGGCSYLWYVKKEDVENIINAVITRFAKIPTLLDNAKSFKQSQVNLSQDDLFNLKLITETDSIIKVNDVPAIEVNSTYQIVFKSIPKNTVLPKLVIKSLQPGIVEISGTTIKAINPGKAQLEFYKYGDHIPFDKKEVTVFQDKSVKKVEISTDKQKLAINDTIEVHTKFYPEDAENIGDYSLVASNCEIIEADGLVVKAIKSGKTDIAVQVGDILSNTVSLEVMSDLKKIDLGISTCNLIVGEEKNINLSLLPQNAYNKDIEWFTSDQRIATVDYRYDGVPFIKATGIGDALIVCKAKKGNAKAECKIHVDSTIQYKGNKSIIITIIVIIIIVFIVINL